MTSQNKKVIETYFSSVDRTKLAPMLADDVVWVEWVDGVPASGHQTRGRNAFIENSGDDELKSEISRMIEEGNIVVAEGTVRVHKKDGKILSVRFCNIFELENGKIKRLDSFGALLKDSE
jgi:ketosteroid isomerase-like protein